MNSCCSLAKRLTCRAMLLKPLGFGASSATSSRVRAVRWGSTLASSASQQLLSVGPAGCVSSSCRSSRVAVGADGAGPVAEESNRVGLTKASFVREVQLRSIPSWVLLAPRINLNPALFCLGAHRCTRYYERHSHAAFHNCEQSCFQLVAWHQNHQHRISHL